MVSPLEKQPTKTQKLVLLGTLLATFGYRALHLAHPSLRDEGVFAFIAQDFLRGHLPLTSLIDQKGVLLYLEMALALSIFGDESIAGIRILAALFICLSLWVMFEIGRRTFGARVALLSSVFLAAHISLRSLDANQCGSEIFATLPCLLSVLCVWYGFQKRSSMPFLLGGVFLGLALWTRATYIFLALFFIVFLAIFESRDRKLKTCSLGILGALLGSAPILLWYLWHGQLETLFFVNYSFNRAWGTAGPYIVPNGDTRSLSNLTVFLQRCSILVTAPLLALLVWKSKTVKREALAFVLMWTVASFLMFWVAGIHLQKQVVQFLPPLALLAALSVHIVWDSKAKALKVVMGILILVSLALTGAGEGFGIPSRPEQNAPKIFHQSKRLAYWLKSNCQSGETIYLWGLEWQVYFHSKLRPPSRQINLQYIIAVAISAELGLPYFQRILPEIEKEVLEPFESGTPPKFLIFTAKLDDYQLSDFSLPGKLEKVLVEDYDFLFSEEPFYVFLRKGESLSNSEFPLPLARP